MRAPVLISGLRGSGSRIVADTLTEAGLRLVPEGFGEGGGSEDVDFASLNDHVLAAVGASWDSPPGHDVWLDCEPLRKLRKRAETLVTETSREKPWGWKDSRIPLTLPFWSEVLPEQRLVMALRHPMAVADLLRGYDVSVEQSLSLWRDYAERVLDKTTPTERLVVSVEELSTQPGVLKRLVGFAGLPALRGSKAAAVAGGIPKLDKPRTCQMPADIEALYARLMEEAIAPPRSRKRPAAVGRGGTEWPGLFSEAETRDHGAGGVSTNGGRKIPSRVAAQQEQDPRSETAIEARVAALETSLRELASSQYAMRTEMDAREERLLRLLEDLHDGLEQLSPSPDQTAPDDYTDLVRRVTSTVRNVVPFHGTVAVITRGDDALLRFFGRRGLHFPQDVEGRWLGYHPKNSLAAIAQLETLRALGADHLVVPAPSYWWFEKYDEFFRRLTCCYVEIPSDPEVCRIFSLLPNVSPRLAVQAFLDQERTQRGSVEVLDLTTAGDLADHLPEVEVFRPPILAPGVPYADQSVPVVAVDTDAPETLAEAERVATVAVLDLAHDRVNLLEDRQAQFPSVSVIMPVLDNPSLTDAALKSLMATLPAGFTGEIIVVDDGSADETRLLLERWAAQHPLGCVLRNPRNRGYLPSVVRGIEAATSTYLLLVNNDMVFLDGWLEPLLRTFEDFPDAGAAGGRLIYPDGRLQEAGGLLFADGSAAKYGYGDADNERPGYTFVRRVDYCSGCLLLTPRAVFEDVGGVDRSFDPGYYEDTDYCLRLRLSGRTVYYQPESVVIHVEGGTAGTDLNVGMKRHQALNHARFVEKWGPVLREMQPERPDPCDDAALDALVLRHTPVTKVKG